MDNEREVLNDRKYSTKFHESHDYKTRLKLSAAVLNKHPDRIPIIAEAFVDNYRYGLNKKIHLNRNKYLCPQEYTYFKFIYEIRKHISNLDASEAIFLFIVTPNKLHLPDPNATMASLYNTYKQNDGFLYYLVCLEQCYGSLNN